MSIFHGVERLFRPPGTLFPADRSQSRLVLIDGARGFAAIAVLFAHYQNFFYPVGDYAPVADYLSRLPLYSLFGILYEYGRNGVPLFWMISGFVFTHVYYGQSVTSGDFTKYRFARLYPLHFLTLCVVAILQILSVWQYGRSLIFEYNDLYHFVLQIFFASNWGFERGFSFNGPIWSVSVEILIYGVFWLTRRWLPRFGIIGPLLLALLFLSGKFLWPGNQIALCGFFFFIGGAICSGFAALSKNLGLLSVTAGGLLIAGIGGFAMNSATWFQLVGLPGTFGALILLLAMGEGACPAWLKRPLTVIGDNTYGMYLWHIPIQLLIFLAVGGRIAHAAESSWFLLLFLGLVSIVARVGYLWFERPMRQRLRGALTSIGQRHRAAT